MNDEDNILLQIKRMEDGIAMQCRCEGLMDLSTIAYSVASLAKETPILAVLIIEALNKVAHEDEDNVVEVPDFNNILKNIK